MGRRIILLSIAVVVVGLFALPNTLSLFAGQHTFYNGTEVDCHKCHDDIYEEMSSNSFGTSSAHTVNKLKDCMGCHKTGSLTNVPLGNGTFGSMETNITANPDAHAAVTLECVACHTAVHARINGSDEAHQPYYNKSLSDNSSLPALKGANEACIGCHTHITVNITWRRTRGYNIDVNETTGDYVIGFSTNSSAGNLYTTYSATQ